jgi:hypothetical protein
MVIHRFKIRILLTVLITINNFYLSSSDESINNYKFNSVEINDHKNNDNVLIEDKKFVEKVIDILNIKKSKNENLIKAVDKLKEYLISQQILLNTFQEKLIKSIDEDISMNKTNNSFDSRNKRVLGCNVENINEDGDNSSSKKSYFYDIKNRIHFKDLIKVANSETNNNAIIAFTMLNFRQIVKLDSGIFTGKLFLILDNFQTLNIVDERNTLLFNEKILTQSKGLKILNYGFNEEKEFFIIVNSDNNTNSYKDLQIIKYQLDFFAKRKLILDNENSANPNTTSMNFEVDEDNSNVSKKDYNETHDGIINNNYSIYSNYINKYNKEGIYISKPEINSSLHRKVKVTSHLYPDKQYDLKFYYDSNKEKNVFVLKEMSQTSITKTITDILAKNNFNTNFDKNIKDSKINVNSIKLHTIKGKKRIICDTELMYLIFNSNLVLKNAYLKNNFSDYYKLKIPNYSDIYNPGVLGLTYLRVSQIFPFMNYIGVTYKESSIFHILNFDNLNELILEIDLSNQKSFDFLYGFNNLNLINSDFNYTNNNNDDELEYLYYDHISDSRTNNIVAFSFDQFNNLLYFLTSELNLFVVSIKMLGGNDKSVKEIRSKSEDYFTVNMVINIENYIEDNIKDELTEKEFCINNLKIEGKNNRCIDTSIEVIRKDLFIKINNHLVIVSLENFNNQNNDFSNFPNISYKNLVIKNQKYEVRRLENMIVLRTNSNYFILLKSFLKHHNQSNKKNSDVLLLYEVLLPNNSFTGNEEFSFNFKIPVIFVALIFLLAYHYFNKKKNVTDEESIKIREELLDQLKKEGINLNKYKKEDKNIQKKDSRVSNSEDKIDTRGPLTKNLNNLKTSSSNNLSNNRFKTSSKGSKSNNKYSDLVNNDSDENVEISSEDNENYEIDDEAIEEAYKKMLLEKKNVSKNNNKTEKNSNSNKKISDNKQAKYNEISKNKNNINSGTKDLVEDEADEDLYEEVEGEECYEDEE